MHLSGYRPEICLVDNSTDLSIAGQNARWCAEQNLLYLKMNGNQGLSAAYNQALDQVAGIWDWIVLLDDDSHVETGYFDALLQAQLRFPETAIFIPQVYDATGLLSPCRIRGCRMKRIRKDRFIKSDHSLETVSMDGLSAINSGMAIKAACFQDYRYDRHLFLDCIDHLFLYHMKKQGAAMRLLYAELRQDFADNRTDLAGSLARFRIYNSDYRYYCQQTGQKSVCCSAILWVRAAKLAWRYHDLRFFRSCSGRCGKNIYQDNNKSTRGSL